jgi:hypothetical protein
VVARARLAGRTLLDIGGEIGLTRERVRQIEQRVLLHLDGSRPIGGVPRPPRPRRRRSVAVGRARARRATVARKAAAWDYLWSEERPRLTGLELAAIERARLLAGLPDPLRVGD